MNLPRGQKLLLGAATVWPLLYFVIFFGFIGLMVVTEGAGGSEGPVWMFACIFPLHLFTIFDSLALLVIYIILLFKKLDAPDNERLMWALIIVLGSFVGQAAFYFLKVLPEPSVAGEPTSAESTSQEAPSPHA